MSARVILDSDEKVVLDDGKLVLTNKRLIRVDEIALEDIEKAYTHTEGGLAQSRSAKLKMKDGRVRELNLSIGGGDALGMRVSADIATIMTRALWVNAVNQQLRLKRLQKRARRHGKR